MGIGQSLFKSIRSFFCYIVKFCVTLGQIFRGRLKSFSKMNVATELRPVAPYVCEDQISLFLHCMSCFCRVIGDFMHLSSTLHAK